MTPAVETVIVRVLEHEGGVADVGDGKGVTRYGQTSAWLEDNGFVPPSSAADAAVNYETWMVRTRLADLCERDVSVGYLVTDWAVHAGLPVAVRGLQAAVGVPVDGVLGPVTLEAVTPAVGPRVARGICAARLRQVGRLLGAAVPDRRRWAAGWCARLADQILTLP